MGDNLWLQLQNMKQHYYSFSLSDIELMDHFPGPFDNFISSQIPAADDNNNIPHSTTPAAATATLAGPDTWNEAPRKRKSISPANSSAYSSPDDNNRIQNTKKRSGKGKKVRTEDEKQRDVVHVRARRGQATDRHSLAERVRRKKINERLRCLQDIVPGCYKTMGMAVMLDEIINYVQSLQTQVEFLSTRLTTASACHDFNPNGNAFDTTQRANAFEALNFENIAAEGVSSSSPLGLNFGYYPQLPRNT